MFGPLKKLFGKQTNEPPTPVDTTPPSPIREVRAPAPPPRPPVAPQPVTAPVHHSNVGTTADAAETSPEQERGEMIAIPLGAILAALPDSLPQAGRTLDRGELYLPAKKVIAQLATGSVKVSFGEIRDAAPPGVFGDDSSHDQTQVELPLSEILSRLNPSLLPQRTGRKRLDAPPEVRDLFGTHGQALPQPPPDKSTAPKPAPRVAASPAPAPIRPSAPITAPSAATTQPGPKPSMPAPRAVAPEASASAPKESYASPGGAGGEAPGNNGFTVPLSAISGAWPEAVRQEISLANVPEASVSLPFEKVEQAMKTGKLVFAWKDISQWTQPSIPAATATQSTLLDIPLKVILPLFMAQQRPGKVQKKIAIGENIPDMFAGSGATKPTIAAPAASPPAPAPSAPPPPKPAPMAPVVPKPQIQMPAAPVPRPSGVGLEIKGPEADLPQSAPAVPKSVPAAEDRIAAPKIPLQPAPEKPLAPPVPLSPPEQRIPAPSIPLFNAAPSMAAVSSPDPSSVAAPEPSRAPASVLGEIFGQPGKKDWSPNEVVQKSLSLKGVAGALIAMQDGLLVAAQLAAPLEAENIAAFLPQIFGRMTQYTNQLNLGALSSLNVGVGGASWHFFKSGGVYFAVVSKPGEMPSEAQLSSIAVELGKQTK